jgi:hypothetical protein
VTYALPNRSVNDAQCVRPEKSSSVFDRLTQRLRALLGGNGLRSLRRQLPSVHRGWVRVGRFTRPETNAEYRSRLQVIAEERRHENQMTTRLQE